MKHNDNNNSNNEPMKEVQNLTARETKYVWYWRVGVIVWILTIALAVSLGTYFILQSKEYDEFQDRVCCCVVLCVLYFVVVVVAEKAKEKKKKKHTHTHTQLTSCVPCFCFVLSPRLVIFVDECVAGFTSSWWL
jgi:L-asparagine transporter-like permease